MGHVDSKHDEHRLFLPSATHPEVFAVFEDILNLKLNNVSFFMFQLLGHLLIVAKNVAKQESLTEGYRVGKLIRS